MTVRSLTAAALGIAIWAAGPASAQTAGAGSTGQAVTGAVPASLPACAIVNAAPAANTTAQLVAVCGARAAPIGPADQFSASVSATGAALAVLKAAGRTRVWLASPTPGGGIVLEEMTRELAKLGGRAGDLGLGDLAVDASRFAIDGSVAVVTASGPRPLDLTTNIMRAAAVTIQPADQRATGN